MSRSGHRQPAQALASLAVAGVVLVAVVLALSNLALWLHAQNVVVAAAQEAAAVAAREDALPNEGQRTARALLVASLGSSAEHVTTIDVRIDPDVVTADVRGSWPVIMLGPLANAPLHATASLERERFRPGGR